MLIGQLRIGDFFIADPDLHQDPAFPHCCLSKWSLQESFAFVPSSLRWLKFLLGSFSKIG